MRNTARLFVGQFLVFRPGIAPRSKNPACRAVGVVMPPWGQQHAHYTRCRARDDVANAPAFRGAEEAPGSTRFFVASFFGGSPRVEIAPQPAAAQHEMNMEWTSFGSDSAGRLDDGSAPAGARLRRIGW